MFSYVNRRCDCVSVGLSFRAATRVTRAAASANCLLVGNPRVNLNLLPCPPPTVADKRASAQLQLEQLISIVWATEGLLRRLITAFVIVFQTWVPFSISQEVLDDTIQSMFTNIDGFKSLRAAADGLSSDSYHGLVTFKLHSNCAQGRQLISMTLVARGAHHLRPSYFWKPIHLFPLERCATFPMPSCAGECSIPYYSEVLDPEIEV